MNFFQITKAETDSLPSLSYKPRSNYQERGISLCTNLLSLKQYITKGKEQNRSGDQTGQLGPDDQHTLSERERRFDGAVQLHWQDKSKESFSRLQHDRGDVSVQRNGGDTR